MSWQGVCSSNPVCTFSAGSATSVQAVFGVTPPPQTTAVTTTPVTTTPVTTTTVVKTGPTAFAAHVERVGTKRRAGRRLVVLTLVSDRLARATGRAHTARADRRLEDLALRTGRTALQLKVPKGLGRAGASCSCASASADRRGRSRSRSSSGADDDEAASSSAGARLAVAAPAPKSARRSHMATRHSRPRWSSA